MGRTILEMTRREPFVNNFADIEYMLKVLTNETGTRFEFEAYDLGHLYTLAYYLDLGLVKPPIFIQFVMGTFGDWAPIWWTIWSLCGRLQSDSWAVIFNGRS